MGYCWTCENYRIKIPTEFMRAEVYEENVQLKMEINVLFKDGLTRQANEAIPIKNCKPEEILNSKSEFNHPPITRIVVDRKY